MPPSAPPQPKPFLGKKRLHFLFGVLSYYRDAALLQDMAWCQGYAFQNRKFMLDLMVDSVNQVTKASPSLERSVNIHHNYCQCERCQYTVRADTLSSTA